MRVPAYRQLESIDCGPTCIRMICAYYGKKHSLGFLKDKCSFSRLGISIADIIDCCKSISLDAVAVKGNCLQLNRLPLPIILYWKQNHYVVLYKIRKYRNQIVYYIADPAFGKVKLLEDDFKKQWLNKLEQGTAILIQPTDTFFETEVLKDNANYVLLKEILKKYKQYKNKIIISSLLLLISVIFSWILPILFQKVIDSGVLNKDMPIVWKLMFVQLAFFIGYMLSNNFSSIILMKANFSISIDFLSELLNKIIRLPIKFFDTRLNTDLIQRLEDQERLQNFLTFRVIDIFFSLINLIVFSSLLIYYNVTVFSIFFITACIVISWTIHFLKQRKFLDYSRFSAQAENKNNIYELIVGMTEIKINNAQNTRISVWRDTQSKINDIGLKALYLNYYQLIGTSFANKIKDILITTLCAYLVIHDQMTLGIMMSISYILGQLTGPVNQITQITQAFQDAKISLDRLSEVQSKKDEYNQDKLPVNFTLSTINIKSAYFKYEGSYNEYVLKNLTMTIEPHKTTAIVGNSGSGKTTLLKLLLGFYYPQKGHIITNNAELYELNIDDWRRKCGVVMQDGYIFSGSIAENIALGDSNINWQRIEYAAQIACIDEHIVSLPNKYQTKIGKSGIDLSGGQKQRILIARAVYKNPELIIFDEATSHLDTTNESNIMNNLKSFFANRTVIIVAHRLSTVVNADKIVYLEKGCIMEEGTHYELLHKQGYYFNLIRNQLELEQ